MDERKEFSLRGPMMGLMRAYFYIYREREMEKNKNCSKKIALGDCQRK